MTNDVNIDVKVTGLSDLRQQLRGAKDEILAMNTSGIIDPAKMEAAVARAGRLKDELNHTNEQIKIMSGGSDFEKVSTGLGMIGTQLKDMDFEGAAQSAKTLTGIIRNMSPAEVMNGFKQFTSVITQLGTAFFEMGLKLLANPLFLLIAVITAIVVIIVMFKDKIKILQDAFDILMMPINLVIEGLKKLGDWLGLTSFAVNEEADKEIAAAERKIEANKKVTDSVDKEYSRQIALAKAHGEDVHNLETAQLKEHIETAKSNRDTYEKEMWAKREKYKTATDVKDKEALAKDINALKDKMEQEVNTIKDSNNQIEVNELNHTKMLNDEADKRNEKQKKLDKEAADRQKKWIEDRRRAIETAEDLEIEAMDDGIEKELKQNDMKTKRLIEATKRDTTLTQNEKTRIIEDANFLNLVNDEKIRKTYKERDEKEELERQKHFDVMLAELDKYDKDQEDLEKQYSDFVFQNTANKDDLAKAALKKKYDDELKIIKDALDKKLITQEEYDKKESEINKLADNAEKKRKELVEDEKVKKEIDTWTKVAKVALGFANQINAFLNQADQQRITDIEKEHTQETTMLDQKQQKELNSSNLSEAQKKAVNDKYAKLKYQADLKAWQESEKIKKEQFNRDKAFKMAGVVIDTASAVMKGYGEVGPIAGSILAALTIATGVMQLATIASQTYNGAAGPSAPTSGLSAGPGGSSTALSPLMNDGGDKNKLNNVSDTPANAGKPGSNITVHAIVSETEVTNVQGKVNRMQRSAEL